MSGRFGDDSSRPYFLWSEHTTLGQFRAALAAASEPEKARLLGTLLREARDTDVWEFTTVREVRALYPQLERYLGRRRPFWRYLLTAWAAHGIA
jgi:hypothetical protein